MERQFDITAEFDYDLRQLPAADRSLIVRSLDYWGGRIDAGSGEVPTQILFQPSNISSLNDVEPSLYGMRIGERLRLILTVEHDPLFEQDVWTLIRAVPKAQFETAFQTAADLLYPQLQDASVKHG